MASVTALLTAVYFVTPWLPLMRELTFAQQMTEGETEILLHIVMGTTPQSSANAESSSPMGGAEGMEYAVG